MEDLIFKFDKKKAKELYDLLNDFGLKKNYILVNKSLFIKGGVENE